MQKQLVIILWDLDYGGIQTRLETLLRRLSEKPYSSVKVTLLLKRAKPIRIELPKSPQFVVKSFSEDLYSGSQLQFGIWLLQQIWQIRPTHTLTFSNRFSCLAVLFKEAQLLLGRKVHVTVSEEIFLSNYLKQYESGYWYWLIRLIYPFADTILVLTNAMRSDLLQSFRLKKEKIKLIPTWIVAKVDSTTGPKKSIDVLFVGRLAAEKRVIWLISLAKYAKKNHQHIRIVIAGDGPEMQFLKKIAQQNGLQESIQFLGYQTKNETRQLLLKSKMFVLPSVNEGLPMVILEAAAQGVPAVIANFAGAQEVVVNGMTGLIVSNSVELNKTIFRLLQNDELLHKLGQNARRKVITDYSMKNVDLFIKSVLA